MATSWQAAKVRIVLDAFDVIVLRDRVRDASALEMLRALRGLPHAPVIESTPDGDLETAVRLLHAGAADCVMRHLADWSVELRRAIQRLTTSARHSGTTADRFGGGNEDAAVLAALLLQNTRGQWLRALPVR